jgi:predicted ATPase
MNLKIKDFGVIKNADIKVDGITVITGNNNTGKSTIGKVFFSYFNSFHDMEIKIDNVLKKKRYADYMEYLTNVLLDIPELKDISRQFIRISIRKLSNKFVWNKEPVEGDEIEKIIQEVGNRYNVQSQDIKIIQKLMVRASEEKLFDKYNADIDESEIEKEIVTRYFNLIFDGQINSLSEQKDANISINIQGKNLSLVFIDNQCQSIVGNLTILHQAFYLDDPFIADELNDRLRNLSLYDENQLLSIREHLLLNLSDLQENSLDKVADAVIFKDKLGEIDTLLNNVVEGEFIIDNDGLKLNQVKYMRPIKVSNLSTGLKSFVIIKRLLELGNLRNKDVLILDEPEIHLHPEWQIIYAKLIVLLQQKFDLSIIVTTHSVEFLDAIDYYSKYYKINDKCNYYMSVEKDGGFEFQHVEGDLDKIYEKMIRPGLILDKLKYNLEENE